VTHLHHHWGAPEAEIFVFKFLPWPGGLNPGPRSLMVMNVTSRLRWHPNPHNA